MQFKPKTQKELDLERLLPDGEYDFEVAYAEDKTSSTGNPMIAVKLSVFAADGGTRSVRDWLMEKMAFKLRHFAYATGMGAEYESGELAAANIVGRSGRCKIASEEGKGDFPASNKVKDYIVSADAPARKPAPNAAPKLPAASTDDTVPF